MTISTRMGIMHRRSGCATAASRWSSGGACGVEAASRQRTAAARVIPVRRSRYFPSVCNLNVWPMCGRVWPMCGPDVFCYLDTCPGGNGNVENRKCLGKEMLVTCSKYIITESVMRC